MQTTANNTRTMGNKQVINSIVYKCQTIAQKSEMTHRHGAVIVYNNEIVAEGWNHLSDSLVNLMSVHAEVSAINQLKKKMRGEFIPLNQCDLYVVRIGGGSCKDSLRTSKPCDRCSSVIQRNGLRRVFYST